MAHHHKLNCLVKRLDFSVVITEKVQNSSERSSGDISSTAEPSVSKLDMVMHHYEPDCLSKRLVFHLQGQGHS